MDQQVEKSNQNQQGSHLGFSEENFLNACKQLDTKDIDEADWEFFVATHDVEIYRNYNKDSGLYSYKVYGFLRNVKPEICAQVYMDLDYRKIWDSYVSELEEIVREDGEYGAEKLIYWRVAYPWPMSHRDYVYCREMREIQHNGQKKFVVLARSVPCGSAHERSGVIRVTDYLQSCALTTDGAAGSKAYMHYYDDPKGMLPTWVINWAAKEQLEGYLSSPYWYQNHCDAQTGVPQFLTQMQEACRGYEKYKRDKAQGKLKK